MESMAKSLSVDKIAVAGDCPACGAQRLQRYEVLSEGGWFRVVKCQVCLRSVERKPWNRLGYVTRNHADVVIASHKRDKK
jgi:uncharacterized Zn finger protein